MLTLVIVHENSDGLHQHTPLLAAHFALKGHLGSPGLTKVFVTITQLTRAYHLITDSLFFTQVLKWVSELYVVFW